jgi:hypothetical protein
MDDPLPSLAKAVLPMYFTQLVLAISCEELNVRYGGTDMELTDDHKRKLTEILRRDSIIHCVRDYDLEFILDLDDC